MPRSCHIAVDERAATDAWEGLNGPTAARVQVAPHDGKWFRFVVKADETVVVIDRSDDRREEWSVAVADRDDVAWGRGSGRHRSVSRSASSVR